MRVMLSTVFLLLVISTSLNLEGTWAQSTSSAKSTDAATDSPQSDQAMSLGDVARLARARKASQPKAIRIFDSENMPHAPLGSGEKAPGLDSTDHGKVTLIDFWASWWSLPPFPA